MGARVIAQGEMTEKEREREERERERERDRKRESRDGDSMLGMMTGFGLFRSESKVRRCHDEAATETDNRQDRMELRQGNSPFAAHPSDCRHISYLSQLLALSEDFYLSSP